jgi:hypothetical protein
MPAGAVPAETIEAIRQQTKLPVLRQSLRLAAVKSPDEVRVFLEQAGK